MTEIKIQQRSKGNDSPNNVSISFPGKKIERELKTIMELIYLISKESDFFGDDNYNSRDIEHKIEGRFGAYSSSLKKDWTDLQLLYTDKINTAKKELGMTDIQSDKVAYYLRCQSNKFLKGSQGNPVLALEKLTSYFREVLVNGSGEDSKNEDFDFSAIKYYLFDELIKCNIFPNPEEL